MNMKVDDRKKIQFTTEQSPIIKEETTVIRYRSGIDHISHFLGLYPAYLPEIQHFCLWRANYYSSLPIAAYYCHTKKCHVKFPKHTNCGICHLKFS